MPDDAITIKGGSIDIEFSEDEFKEDPYPGKGRKKFILKHNDKRITRVTILVGNKADPVTVDIDDGKCTIKAEYATTGATAAGT